MTIAEETKKTIGVIGAGAWGTALAQIFAANGQDVLIQAREPETVDAINTTHENTVFLPGIPLDKRLKATGSAEEAAARDILLMVTPAQHFRSVLEQLSTQGALKTGKPIVICSKGIELKTGLLLSQVAEEVDPGFSVAVLTGPTFAHEIARGLPGAVTIGMKDARQAESLQNALGTRYFRPYVSDDLTGVQLGGALKNVVAIACGIAHGLELGESARAALLTRGLAEITRLTVAMGGRAETLLGLSGIGDLTLTASSMQSRNFSLGAALGAGKTLEEILGPRRAVTEGVHTAAAAVALAAKYGADMPIAHAVDQCLNAGLPVKNAMETLLSRPFKQEL